MSHIFLSNNLADMSLFNIFKKKPQGPTLIDKVWVDEPAKVRACIKKIKENPFFIFLTWSEITLTHFSELLKFDLESGVEFMHIDKIIPGRMTGKEFVFLEHHFDRQKETSLINSLKLKEAVFFNSLDDHLFSALDGERIKKVMRSMGEDDDEPLEHIMITKSIQRAQDKILETGISDDQPASTKAWYNSLR